ncbi:hypothetical protein I3J27_35200 [Bradyrhizobium xenonodulans]|uniref:Uncharacterized protein n=1 Tax=Bradyrhizobium xenonodulans TaxID=2736875 RepID=A0ABY7MIA3_9BRAD|nr:hypothetical protein [Bradyrhizobium xenonodulans]WBL78135.1 hypothetical protein I3J27_35200 [Bradyrhizobium xenonodulans]
MTLVHSRMPNRSLRSSAQLCPQVYYTLANPQTRLRKSIDDYKALIPTAEFASRYKPTGNITMTEDVAFPGVATCLTATSKFLALVNSNGFPS